MKGDDVARLYVRDPGARLDDLAHHLVADDHGVVDIHAACARMVDREARAAGDDARHGLAFPGRRVGYVFI